MNSGDELLKFFIVIEPSNVVYIKPGSLCFASESVLTESTKKSSKKDLKIPVFCISSRTEAHLDRSVVEQLSLKEAELLQALDSDKERLRCFREQKDLLMAKSLTVGSEVSVSEGRERLHGIIRFIGGVSEPKSGCPISGVLFGVELQGSSRGKGKTDGKYHGKEFFKCERNCGIFVPFSKVEPFVPPSPLPLTTQPEVERISVGDTVTFFSENQCYKGMVLDIGIRDGKEFFTISTETDENGKIGGEMEVPIECIFKGDVYTELEAEKTDIYSGELQTKAVVEPCDSILTLNSMVEVSMAKGNAYGIIRWIGTPPKYSDIFAGLELEEDQGVSDGTFQGERKFTCPPKRGLFIRLSACRPDSRFMKSPGGPSKDGPHHDVTEADTANSSETVPPISTEDVPHVLIGQMKGIQGHCNSCYMDAALFSLFSCSSVLDSMLFKSTSPEDAPIQDTLLHNIVNPLRSKGFVEGQHIMKLRRQLQKHGYSRSFTTDEKDPEEFLTVIMHHILALDPLLKLSAGGKVQDSYYYQIFPEQNHSLVLPTVQQLLECSFHGAGLKLAQVPSCLILQMPRFGKKFKMFDKIIPSLELDITELLSEGPQQCILCGALAQVECADCFKDPVFSQSGFKVFCDKCSTQVHKHSQRRKHRPSPLTIPPGFGAGGLPHSLSRDKMELFAVLCIETSHYVSFVKYGPESQDWIFFDSMADRQGELDGFNIPAVSACPEVGMYLDMSPVELANQVPRDMKGVAKRLFCDAYMYLYQSTSMMMYC